MSLQDDLRTIELLAQIRHNTRINRHDDYHYFNYNEMTFIPYLALNKANINVKQKVPIQHTIEKLTDFINKIKETDLYSLDNEFQVRLFSSSIAPNMQHKNRITAITNVQDDINEAWLDFFCYGQVNAPKLAHDPRLVGQFEDQRELIKNVGQELNVKFIEMQRFLLSYYTLSEQLSTSLLHEADRLYVISSMNKYAATMPAIEDIVKLNERYTSLNQDYLKTLKQEIVKINPDTFITKADRFIEKELKSQQEHSVENFLATKLLSDGVFASLELTASQKIEKVFVFDDKSLAYKQNNQYHTIKEHAELEQFISDIHHESLAFLLRKKPKLISVFQNKLKEDNSYSNAIKATTSFLDNYTILKQYNFDVNSFNHQDFEMIDDSIHDIVNKNKIKQFANSILSSKYKHHFNDETEPYFKELLDNNVTTSQLQTFVGKKIAAMKSNEDVVKMLSGLLDHFNGFTPESLTEKLKALGVEKLYDNDNVVTFEVDDYNQCKSLGSTSWCIVRDQHYFEQYAKEGNNRQYIMYDFNKASTDIHSMIGFTVEGNGRISAEHLKNDDAIYSFNKDKSLDDIQTKTIYINKERHFLSEETIEKMEETLNIKTVQNNKPLKMRMA